MEEEAIRITRGPLQNKITMVANPMLYGGVIYHNKFML